MTNFRVAQTNLCVVEKESVNYYEVAKTNAYELLKVTVVVVAGLPVITGAGALAMASIQALGYTAPMSIATASLSIADTVSFFTSMFARSMANAWIDDNIDQDIYYVENTVAKGITGISINYGTSLVTDRIASLFIKPTDIKIDSDGYINKHLANGINGMIYNVVPMLPTFGFSNSTISASTIAFAETLDPVLKSGELPTEAMLFTIGLTGVFYVDSSLETIDSIKDYITSAPFYFYESQFFGNPIELAP